MWSFDKKLYKAVALLVAIISIGVMGFAIVADLGFIDALYMTMITISTVGYSEVVALDQTGRLFAILFILLSITVFGYIVSIFTELLISGNFFQQLKNKRVKQQINKFKEHTIVCGFGRNGEQAVDKLKKYKQDVVVVELDKELIKNLEIQKIQTIEGDATLDEVLIDAGILKAKNLITALPSDADNLFVVLTARQLNKQCKIISRASEESSYKKLKIAGADNIIMPDKIGGAHMATLVTTPDIVEFVDKITFSGDTAANLEEIAVNNLPKKFLGKSILDLDLRKNTGCTVIGFKNNKKDYIINPEAETLLKENTYLIILGRPEQIKKLKELYVVSL